jgi:hypothetical protein
MTLDLKKWQQTFFPFYAQKEDEVSADPNSRFVHYSSAEALIGILRSQQMWMRNASLMNDFLEIEYGAGLLDRALDSPAGERLMQACSEVDSSMPDRLRRQHNAWLESYRESTYIISLSEHLPNKDEFGRLSMWRAYAPKDGIALVLKKYPFFAPTTEVSAYTHPVLYADEAGFYCQFEGMVEALAASKEYLAELGSGAVFNSLFHAFQGAVLATKHQGFSEEREWRVVYSPGHERSKHIDTGVEIVRGLPQLVCKLPLKRYGGAVPLDVSLGSILDRIIVGPSAHSKAIREAVAYEMGLLGIPDPESKVFVSKIPLRTG